MNQIRIYKLYSREEDFESFNIKIMIPFFGDRMTVNLNAVELENIDWSDYITKSTVSKNFTDTHGSQCDNGYLTISKRDDRIYFDSDSATGYGFKFSIPFAEIESELKELDEWYKKIKSN